MTGRRVLKPEVVVRMLDWNRQAFFGSYDKDDMTSESDSTKKLRSEHWFNDREHLWETAIYVEKYLNFGLTREELQAGKPIIGIAQTGGDLTPCNRIHVSLADRVRDGVRAAGGIPFEFPVHPIAEQGKRPTSGLDRNLAYLGLVEILFGYPIDGVVLTTGCDKTTPACIMAAATMDLPSIVLSGGPMLDNYWEGKLAGSAQWHARHSHSAGEIDDEEFMEIATSGAPSMGHCNTMGTALSMNCLAEALGMSLPGCASIPAPYRERGQMAYRTGQRIVDMVHEDLTPSKILTPEAFQNAVVANSAIGGSTNCPVHITAIARHIGGDLPIQDWETFGHEIPLLVNCKPAGEFLAEGFHRGGGLPAVMGELARAGMLNEECVTANGKTIGENYRDVKVADPNIIRSVDRPLMENAGFMVLSGNIFDSGLIKTSVIGDAFRERYLTTPGDENAWEGTAVVFEGPEDHRARIDSPELDIDEDSILFIRGCGPMGYPGSAEAVSMHPPQRLSHLGCNGLPCVGDGRQSGTSASPSILNVCPEAAIGGGLAVLRTGDRVRVDLNDRSVNMLIDDDELRRRVEELILPILENQTPWQEIYRNTVGQLDTGACMELAVKYQKLREIIPRHPH